MSLIGVRELREHTGQILRRVSENNEEIQITYHGRVIARLLPAPLPRPVPADLRALWSDVDRLAAEIGARWPAGITAAEAVSEARRDL